MSGQKFVRSIPRAISRRRMLRGALGVGVALPWLDAMMPRSGRAQAVTVPKRLGIFFSPCGTIPEKWAPVGMNPSTATASRTNPAISTEFTLSPILASLADYQRDIVVLRGVSMESTGGVYSPASNPHDRGMGHMLTGIPMVPGPLGEGRAQHLLDGSAGGPSIDQHIAAAIGGGTRLSSLELGVESTSTSLEVMVTHMSYGPVDKNDRYKRAIPVVPVDDPVQVYTRLFGGTDPALLKKRKSVLDYCSNDYQDLMGKVGAGDRAKLDQHLTNLRQIETGLTALITAPACPGANSIVPVSPARDKCLRDQANRNPADNAMARLCVTNFAEIGKMQMDLMTLALACDITRVASLQWTTAESQVVHAMLDLQYTGTKEHHLLSHNETVTISQQTSLNTDLAGANLVRADLAKINTWYAQQFGYLLGKLKGITEANGKTLLDNMLVLWTNELGTGGVHSYTNVPYVLAGSCQGAVQPGRYIDYLGPAVPATPLVVAYGKGPAHNKLFVSMMRSMGMTDNSFNFTGRPGEEDLFSGPLPGL
jgi:Protein of unknown function (DUF1552)